jgi:hypothetical protein
MLPWRYIFKLKLKSKAKTTKQDEASQQTLVLAFLVTVQYGAVRQNVL